MSLLEHIFVCEELCFEYLQERKLASANNGLVI